MGVEGDGEEGSMSPVDILESNGRFETVKRVKVDRSEKTTESKKTSENRKFGSTMKKKPAGTGVSSSIAIPTSAILAQHLLPNISEMRVLPQPINLID